VSAERTVKIMMIRIMIFPALTQSRSGYDKTSYSVECEFEAKSCLCIVFLIAFRLRLEMITLPDILETTDLPKVQGPSPSFYYSVTRDSIIMIFEYRGQIVSDEQYSTPVLLWTRLIMDGRTDCCAQLNVPEHR
jgi:hypothetical protein